MLNWWKRSTAKPARPTTTGMICPELKSRIEHLWFLLHSGGLSNPLDAIEQLSYLLFMRELDAEDTHRCTASPTSPSVFGGTFCHQGNSIAAEQLRWCKLQELPEAELYRTLQEWVFPFLKALHADPRSAYSLYMADAVFKIPTPTLLQRLVRAIDDLYTTLPCRGDTLGDVYEHLLASLGSAGINGQFRTPRHIIRMMVELVHPTPRDRICDPACGSGGFLVEAAAYLRHHPAPTSSEQPQFFGFDTDRTMLRLAAMNLMAHGIRHHHIAYRNSLAHAEEEHGGYSLILANPPFTGTAEAAAVHPALRRTCPGSKTELLFIAHILHSLKPGGRCACIVPTGVLFGTSKAHRTMRKTLVEQHRLHAVISMPKGVFKPYAGVATAILIFSKNTPDSSPVWFYQMKADGFSLNNKRSPIAENDIPDLLRRYRNPAAESERPRSAQSFMVPLSEIKAHGYNLAFNTYSAQTPQHEPLPSASELLHNICRLQQSIDCNLAQLADLMEQDETMHHGN